MNSKIAAFGTVLVVGSLSPLVGLAQEAKAEAKSPHALTGNLSLVTDYRFGGVSQTSKRPAIQGGVDCANAGGLYLGAWASNVSGNLYEDGNSEWDFYGGFTGNLSKSLTYNAGAVYYFYPGAKTGGQKYNTAEIFGGINYQWLGAKLAYALTDFFGIDNGDGSVYIEGNANYPLMEKVTLTAHYGLQKIEGVSGDDDVQDWSLGTAYDWNGVLLGLTYVDADEDLRDAKRDISQSTVVFSLKKTF